VHEVGIVDDRNEQSSFGLGFPGGFDERLFAAGVASFGFKAEGITEDVQGVRIGVQRPGYGRGEDAFGVVFDESKGSVP